MGVTNSEIPVKLYVYPGNWHLDSYLWMSLGHIQKLLEPNYKDGSWMGLHVCAWSTCVCVVCMCVCGLHVCVAYMCAWSACVCVVCMCVHGLHVCSWSACVRVVCVCVHGLHVCEIDPFTLFLTVLESDCDTAFTVAHGSPSFPSWK